MFSCVKTGDKLGIAVVQTGFLYALCTGPTNTSRFFVRRPSTSAAALGTVFTRLFWQAQSVKFSYAHFPQGLLIQINIESY